MLDSFRETSDEKLARAIHLIEEGKKQEASKILANILTVEPNVELAWLWLADCSESRERKVQCLQKAIKINPKRASTQKALIDLMCTPTPIQASHQVEIVTASPRNDLQSQPTTIIPGQDVTTISQQEAITPPNRSKSINITISQSKLNDEIRERYKKYQEELKQIEKNEHLKEKKKTEKPKIKYPTNVKSALSEKLDRDSQQLNQAFMLKSKIPK
jgi:predicted Zn-dependent protease